MNCQAEPFTLLYAASLWLLGGDVAITVVKYCNAEGLPRSWGQSRGIDQMELLTNSHPVLSGQVQFQDWKVRGLRWWGIVDSSVLRAAGLEVTLAGILVQVSRYIQLQGLPTARGFRHSDSPGRTWRQDETVGVDMNCSLSLCKSSIR